MARFSDIAGHEPSLQVLRRALAEGRLHHSLVFHGPASVGKRTVALALAAALNCETTGSRTPGPGLFDEEPAHGGVDSCGACAACRKIEKGIHPDVAYLTLEKTVIPIDAVRALRQEASFRPYEGRARVFIIDPADRLSHDAQNALLKTLEEPAPSSRIVLITTRLMQLLPTTRSRCQALAFGTMPPPVLAERLERVHGMGGRDALRAARLAGGRYGAALEMDLEAHDALRGSLMEILGRAAERTSRVHVLEDAEGFGADPGEVLSRLDMLGTLVRDMMLLSAGGPETGLVHADLSGDLAGLAARLAPGLEAILDRIALARSDIERNVNRKLLVETLLFDIAARRAS